MLCRYSHALAVLEIYNLHTAVSDNNSVGSSESLRHVLAEIQTGFYQQLRVLGLGQCLVKFLQYDNLVRVGVFVHFPGVVLLVKRGYFFLLPIGRQSDILL